MVIGHFVAEGTAIMMTDLAIVEFSRYPAGRTENDGPNNGKRYRAEVLVPALEKAIRSGAKLRISLDGARSYGSSFLDEAFGGLVRDEGYSREEVEAALEITASDPTYQIYRDLIYKFIREATPRTH